MKNDFYTHNYPMIQKTTMQSAPAQQVYTQEAIISLALMNQYVLSARCFEYNDTFVLGVITKPFYLKSDRDKFVKELKNSLLERCSKNAIISLDIDVYCKINDNMTVEQIQELYKKVTQRA